MHQMFPDDCYARGVSGEWLVGIVKLMIGIEAAYRILMPRQDIGC